MREIPRRGKVPPSSAEVPGGLGKGWWGVCSRNRVPVRGDEKFLEMAVVKFA